MLPGVAGPRQIAGRAQRNDLASGMELARRAPPPLLIPRNTIRR